MRRHLSIRRGRAVLFASLLAVGLGAAAQTVNDANLAVTTYTSGLNQPTTMAFVAPNDVLVLEKATGRVRRVVGGVLQANAVLDVAVNSDSERGLLGIAVRLGTPTRVFLYYTEAATDGATAIANRVYRYDWNPAANGGQGALQNGTMILNLPVTPGPNHDGGVMTIDAQDRLYVVIGELNRNGQLQNNPGGAAPDDTGVVLRVNFDGTPALGNPFTPYCSGTTTQTCPTGTGCPGGQTCLTQVARYYAYGVRNCFGVTLDPVTGDLWDTENGPGNYDEINRVTPGSNSGWNHIMGPVSRDAEGTSDLFNMPGAGLTYSDPEFSWLATIAPTGIFFAYGTTWGPGYNDKVLVGDNNNGFLYSFPLNGARTGFVLTGGVADLVADSAAERDLNRLGQGFGVVTHIVKGPDDHVYVVSLTNGVIYRIAGPAPVELLSFDVE